MKRRDALWWLAVCLVAATGWLLLPGRTPQSGPVVAAAEPTPSFPAWADTFQRATTPGERAVLAPLGLELARVRRERMKTLIETDPRAALAEALPYRVRRELPAEVAALVEERVSATGFFGVIATLDEEVKPVTRVFATGGKHYEAFVYGRRLAQLTTPTATLHGIAIDGKLAVAEEPVRVLDADEAAARRPVGPQTCPVSGAETNPRGDEPAVEIAGEVKYLCSVGHIAALGEQILAQEGGDLVAQSAWTTGTKTMLIINLKFSDQASCPDTGSGLTNMMTAVNAFFVTNSFQQTDMLSTVTPCYTLTNTVQWYTTNDTSGYFMNVLTAARQIAANPTSFAGNAGLPAYNYLDYNLEAVRYSGPGGFSGQAFVGGRGCWLKSSSAGIAAHEFGHNYGVWHANFWNCTNDTVTGAGTHVEYGNSFDTMGAAGGGAQHFNANFKRVLDWITDADLHILNTASTSGVFRVTALDHGGNKVAGAKYAIRIPSAQAQRDYWIDFRQLFTGNKWLMNGAVLKWGDAGSDGASRLLDTTPGTADAKNDAGIVIGRTYSDWSRSTHLTPIAKAGTTPQALDVVVNIGTFPGNQPPTLTLAASATNVAANASITFTATATDPEADPLAYDWDFGDRNFGSNTTVVTKSWAAAGYYTVRCTASDMKGGTASALRLIKVGSPTTFNVTGVIRDQLNNPVPAVRVHNNLATTHANYRTTSTDSEGRYILAGLPAGSYTLVAIKSSYTLTAAFSNPITVGPDRADLDFNANQPRFTISGQVTDAGVPVAGALVSDGQRAEPTDSAGQYTLYNVPNASYTLTATKPGTAFSPSGFTNPVTVANANLTGRNFIPSAGAYTVSGEITGVGSLTTVTVTDGYRTTTSARQGNGASAKNVYTLTGVPAGAWNLRAFTATQSFSPTGFANLLTIAGNSTGRNFALDAVKTYAISGTISNALGGVAGVTVAATVTDARGGYYLDQLANGTHALTPTLAGTTFTPASRNVTIAGANSSNQNFLASLDDPPPTIAVPATAVAGAKTAAVSVLGADNNGEPYLRYTWSTTGTPPASVAFALNNANAAKNNTGTFTKAGSYGLRAIVNDVSGGTVTSIVTAVISQTVTALSLAPVSVALNVGATQQFAGNALDQFGDGFQAGCAWSVTGGGTLTAGGLFTATGTGTFTVTGYSGGKTGTATVVVSSAPTVTLTVPAHNASFCGPTNLTLTAVVSGGTVGNVSFHAGTNQLGVVMSPPYTLTWSNVAVGSYALWAQAGVSTSTAVNVSVTRFAIDDWRQQEFGANAGDLVVAGDLADPDGDGLNNLLEYALGLNPNAPNAGVPALAIENDRLTLTYARRKPTADVACTVQVSGTLPAGWGSAEVTEEILADDGTFQTVKAHDAVTLSSSPGRFMRLKVSRP